MALPEINDLQAENRSELDEVTISSNNDGMRARGKVVPIQAVAAPPRAPSGRRPRKKKIAPLYLQQEEIKRLFRLIDSVRDRAIFRLIYHAGLRASEIGLLQMRDYNPRTERLHVERLKGSNSGDHHLCREESRAMHAWLKVRGSDPGALFPSRKGSPIDRRMIWVLMQEYCAAAGIPAKYRHPHVLKHSCATHLLEKGFHIEQVQDWMGHVNIQNTMIYGHITNSRRDEMARALKDTWR